jgi:hypothetical protein
MECTFLGVHLNTIQIVGRQLFKYNDQKIPLKIKISMSKNYEILERLSQRFLNFDNDFAVIFFSPEIRFSCIIKSRSI